MKIILFARHAKSNWNQVGSSDFDRTLNSIGKLDAVVMAKVFQKSTYMIEQIISSDAKRAITTADEYKKLLTPEKTIVLEHSLYLASQQDIASIAQNIDNAFSCVMLVGHNPGMSEVVEFYIDQNFQGMPSCGVGVVGFDVGSWNEIMTGSGQLLGFEYPKKYT